MKCEIGGMIFSILFLDFGALHEKFKLRDLEPLMLRLKLENDKYKITVTKSSIDRM